MERKSSTASSIIVFRSSFRQQQQKSIRTCEKRPPVGNVFLSRKICMPGARLGRLCMWLCPDQLFFLLGPISRHVRIVVTLFHCAWGVCFQKRALHGPVHMLGAHLGAVVVLAQRRLDVAQVTRLLQPEGALHALASVRLDHDLLPVHQTWNTSDKSLSRSGRLNLTHTYTCHTS